MDVWDGLTIHRRYRNILEICSPILDYQTNVLSTNICKVKEPWQPSGIYCISHFRKKAKRLTNKSGRLFFDKLTSASVVHKKWFYFSWIFPSKLYTDTHCLAPSLISSWGCSTSNFVTNSLIVKTLLQRCHAQVVGDGALSQKIDRFREFLEILNLTGHLNWHN